jgi:hypothetical protein
MWLTYIHLAKLLLVLGAPRQSFDNTLLHEGISNAASSNKGVDVNKISNAALVGQLHCSFVVPVAKEVIC